VFVVDTNVLIYAANQDAAEHTRCRALLEEWRASVLPWYLTWPIVYEFLRVVSHPRVLPEPWSVDEAWDFVAALLASPSLGILAPTPRHADLARRTFEELPDLAGNLLHDAHTAIVMREHGIPRVYTRDTDFHRFPFVEVVDPLRV
jgi:hypothetical protein